MKNDLLRLFANLYRNDYPEYIPLSDIYKEMEKIKHKPNTKNGALLLKKLESYCINSNAFTNKEELFKMKEKGSGLWGSCFYESIRKINELNIGDTLTRNELLDIFKVSGMSGIMKSTKTYSLVLISNEENGYYEDSNIIDGKLIYTGQGLNGDQELTGNNLLLANSKKDELPVYLFTKDKNLLYHFEGVVVLAGEPYTVKEKERLVYKFPLMIVNNYDTYENSKEYKKVVKLVKEIEEEYQVTSVSNGKLNFVNEPIKIRKYNGNKDRKSTRKNKPDYVAQEILKTTQGEITEKDVLEYEINRVMQFDAQGLVEEMNRFFDNKKDDEGYDIKSFDIDENGNVIERYIEVKSTTGGETTPIEISDNELRVAYENMQQYFIYRVYNCDKENRKVKVINGPDLFNKDKFECVPTNYRIYGK